jgi:hypothetical protein
MEWLKNLFTRKKKKPIDWDSLDYGQQSKAGDDFRKNNEA